MRYLLTITLFLVTTTFSTFSADRLQKEKDHRPLWFRFQTNTGNRDSADLHSPSTNVTTTFLTTPHGRAFHLAGCKALRKSTDLKIWNSRAEVEAKYGPCSICKP